jgi:tripartite-type tricarboxylate transporter receptor subunit TctC
MQLGKLMLGILVSTALGATSAFAYPEREIKLVVPFPPGPTDTVGRTLAESMRKHLKQPIVVENLGGAGGTRGEEHRSCSI